MRIRLIKLPIRVPMNSKSYASIYTFYMDSDPITQFEYFNETFIKSHKKQVEVFKLKLSSMVLVSGGARDGYFVFPNINPVNNVGYTTVSSSKKLRLYCIYFSEKLLVVGNGGVIVDGKNSTKAEGKLNKINQMMSDVSILIEEKLRLREISISPNKMNFLDNLDINDNGIL